MACTIRITAVNGIVQPGQMDPTSVRVLGTASQCPSRQVQVSIPGTGAPPQIVTVDAFDQFRAELLLQSGATLQCGQNITVHAVCVGSPACYADETPVLECCQFKQLFFRAVSTVGALRPSAILVSGTLLGCASDTVMIGSSVTATVGPIAVDPMTGDFSVQVPIPPTTAVQCDDRIMVVASCGGSSGCKGGRVEGLLFCPPCYRALVDVDMTAPCTGSPAVKPVTFDASIAIPAGATQKFHWEFGDGTVGPTFTINNSAGTAATVHPHTETHDYAAGTYTARLKIDPPPYECAEYDTMFEVTCATGCPAITVDPPEYSQSCVNNKRTVTLKSKIIAGAGPPVFAQWDYGDGSMGPGIVANAGATLTDMQTHDYVPGNYTAQLKVLSPSGCPSQPVMLNVPPCIPPVCTLAVQNVAVQVGPCDPATGTRTVTATATVNNTDPADLYYWQWDSSPAQVGLPASQGTTQQHQYLAPGTGQTSYNITLTVIRSSICVSSFTKTITINGCGAPCPQVTDITVDPQACASSSSTIRPVDLTAQVSNAAGTTYEWDFGDGSPVVTSPTATAPRHDYAAPGTYTAKVTTKTPGCTDTTATKSVSVATCGGAPPPPPPPPPGGGLPSCAALLWVSLIMMLVGGITSIVGCILANWFPQAGLIVGIIGVVVFGIGALLFLIWWIVCRFLTLCAVILAARSFVMAMIALFAVIAIVIGIISIFNPPFRACAAASAIYGFAWGGILAMLDFIADQRRCLIANPSGGSASGSSSSPLMGSSESQRLRPSDFSQRSSMATVGLGDVVSSVTSAMGIKSCSGCRQRAEMLNRRFPLGTRSSGTGAE